MHGEFKEKWANDDPRRYPIVRPNPIGKSRSSRPYIVGLCVLRDAFLPETPPYQFTGVFGHMPSPKPRRRHDSLLKKFDYASV